LAAVQSNNNSSTGTNAFNTTLPTSSLTPASASDLTTKAYVDTKTTLAAVQSNNNTWTGTNAFNTTLPTSSLTPANASDLATKAYVDTKTTLAAVQSNNNTWTGTNTFNTLPTSSATPANNGDLCNKSYVDTKTTSTAIQSNNNTWTGTNTFTGSTSLAATTASSLNVTSGSIGMLANGFNSIYFTDVVGAFTSSVNNYCRMFTVNSIAYIDFYGSRIWRNVGSTGAGGNDVVMTLSNTGNLTITGNLTASGQLKVQSRPYTLYISLAGGVNSFMNAGINFGTYDGANSYLIWNVVTAYGNANASDWNKYTGTFTAPSSGLYHFQLGVFVNETGRSGRWLQAQGTGVMGGSQYLNFDQSYLTSEGSFTISLMYYMTTGQTFYLYCQNQSPICYFANGHTCLQIIKIY